ncbi:MAG: hypothetical protein AB7N76_35015 [Planctomycetota bacterium]
MSDDPTQQIAVRLPESLIARLEAHAARLKRQNPALRLTRADAVRVLLTERLDQVEAQDRAAQ